MKKIKGSSFEEFHPLTIAEGTLVEAAYRGDIAIVSTDRPSIVSASNEIRACFLRFMLLGGDENVPIHAHGIRIRGAYISGELDLLNLKIPSDFQAEQCFFSKDLVLTNTIFSGELVLSGSLVQGIKGNGLSSRGAFLNKGFSATAMIDLRYAKIDGDLDICNSDLSSDNAPSLIADSINISGDLFIRSSNVKSEIRFVFAKIGGDFCCRGSQFKSNSTLTLNFESSAIGNCVSLSDFKCYGAISFIGTNIGGNLVVEKSAIAVSHQNNIALNLNASLINSDMTFNGVSIDGSVHIMASNIGGDVVFSGSYLSSNDSRRAISLEGTNIGGFLRFLSKFKAKGGLLLATTVKGEVRFRAIEIINENKFAIEAKNACFGNLLFEPSCIIKGGISFMYCDFRGQVDFDSINIKTKGRAISIEHSTIVGSLNIFNGSEIRGSLGVANTHVGSDFGFVESLLYGNTSESLFLAGSKIDGTFEFRPANKYIDNISLESTKVQYLADDIAAWGKELILNNFEYKAIIHIAKARERLAWLDLQKKHHAGLDTVPGFYAQPWKELQKALKYMGHFEDARKVGVAFETRLRKAGKIGEFAGMPKPLASLYRFFAQSFHWLFWLFVGYGYRPMRLFFWMVGVWIACAGLYWYLASEYAVFSPTDPLIFQNNSLEQCRPNNRLPLVESAGAVGNWYFCNLLPGEYSTFSPLAFSLDVILPVVDLQQEKSWAPIIPTPKEVWWKELLHLTHNHWGRLIQWFETLFGWLASLLLVALISGLSKRREE